MPLAGKLSPAASFRQWCPDVVATSSSPGGPRTEAEIRKHLTDYYGVITYLDEQIGRILHALDETGQSANTIIIFSSDHGLALGSHGLMGKQNLYEDSMKPPLIFAGPGIRKGKVRSAGLSLRHLSHGLRFDRRQSPPRRLTAAALPPCLTGKSDSARDVIFLAFMDFQRAVRQGDWKLIRYPQVNVSPALQSPRGPQRSAQPVRRTSGKSPPVMETARRAAKSERGHASVDRQKLPETAPSLRGHCGSGAWARAGNGPDSGTRMKPLRDAHDLTSADG